MNIFEDRGGGKPHWKLNLYVLWVCVFFYLCKLYHVRAVFAGISFAAFGRSPG